MGGLFHLLTIRPKSYIVRKLALGLLFKAEVRMDRSFISIFKSKK
jgi:hypothetical protein